MGWSFLLVSFSKRIFIYTSVSSWAQHNVGQISNSGFESRLLLEIGLQLMPIPQLNLFSCLFYIMSIYMFISTDWNPCFLLSLITKVAIQFPNLLKSLKSYNSIRFRSNFPPTNNIYECFFNLFSYLFFQLIILKYSILIWKYYINKEKTVRDALVK